MRPRGPRNKNQKPPRHDLGGFAMRSTITPIPRIPFREIADEVLGKDYELSLVICADKLARRINRSYRNKDYSPNVLSFPLESSSGELFLNVRKAQREAKEMRVSVRERIAHLYVHGCFHLAGYDHSDEMEHKEDVILTKFRLIDHKDSSDL